MAGVEGKPCGGHVDKTGAELAELKTWGSDLIGRGVKSRHEPGLAGPALIQVGDAEVWPLAGAHAEAHRDGVLFGGG